MILPIFALVLWLSRAQADTSLQPNSPEAIYTIINHSLHRAYAALSQDSSPLARESAAKGFYLSTPNLTQKLRSVRDPNIGFKPWIYALEPRANKMFSSDAFVASLFRVFPNLRWPVIRLVTEAEMAQRTLNEFRGTSDICYNGDAFRHTYWTALLSKYFGRDIALVIATSHEIGHNKEGAWSSPLNNNSLMDVGNNLSGIELGQAYRNKSDAALRDEIIRRIRKGRLLMLDPYDTSSSRIVARLVPTMTREAFQKTPDSKRGCADKETPPGLAVDDTVKPAPAN